MPKGKVAEIDWNEGNINFMPEDKLKIVLKKFEEAVQNAKKTATGRRMLAKSFGVKTSDLKL